MPRRTTRRRRTHYTALPTQEDRQHAPGGPIVSVPTPMSKTGIQQTKFIHKLSGRTLETQVDANNPGYLKLHYPADATCDKQSMIIDAECGTWYKKSVLGNILFHMSNEIMKTNQSMLPQIRRTWRSKLYRLAHTPDDIQHNSILVQNHYIMTHHPPMSEQVLLGLLTADDVPYHIYACLASGFSPNFFVSSSTFVGPYEALAIPPTPIDTRVCPICQQQKRIIGNIGKSLSCVECAREML